MGIPAVAKLSSDDSQPVTLPVSPVKLRVLPFVPEQTVAEALTVPPTLTGVTVIVTEDEFTAEQPEACTTAL
jgi:hypothetical protein